MGSVSCNIIHKSPNRWDRVYNRKFKKFEQNDEVVFIKSGDKLRSDTIYVEANRFIKKTIPIIIPGTNTLNFLYLSNITTGQKIDIDSTACQMGEFLILNLKKSDKGKYMLYNWGCHYSRTFYLILE